MFSSYKWGEWGHAVHRRRTWYEPQCRENSTVQGRHSKYSMWPFNVMIWLADGHESLQEGLQSGQSFYTLFPELSMPYPIWSMDKGHVSRHTTNSVPCVCKVIEETLRGNNNSTNRVEKGKAPVARDRGHWSDLHSWKGFLFTGRQRGLESSLRVTTFAGTRRNVVDLSLCISISLVD